MSYLARTGARSLLCCFALLAACGQEIAPPVPLPRPVSYVTLKAMDPGASTTLTGTAEAWKRAEMSFEVRGRVVRMMDPGTDIQGEVVDVNGKRLSKGTVIAALDDERHKIALAESEALHAAALARVEASIIEIESVLPAKLKAAQANAVLQKLEIDRYTKMVAQRSASQQRLDQVEASYTVAQATVAEIKALIETKTSQLGAQRSQAKLTKLNIDQARLDLESCTLVAPFTGQIARVYVISGTNVLPALPVATVQMMDPIKIQVAVSAGLDAAIRSNDFVQVILPNSKETLEGYVYLKDTFADPATRTFLVTILVRNRRVATTPDIAPRDASSPRATNILRLEKRDPAGPGPYFAEVGCLHEDESGFYVWKTEGPQTDPPTDRVLVKKVRVTPGDELLDFVQLFSWRELSDHGDLDPARDFLLRGVTGDVQDGGEVHLVRERWLLRPGDIVEVGLRRAKLEAGIYVPEEAIQYDGQRHSVFVVEGQGDQRDTAARVEVRVGKTFGKLQRVEPVADGRLTEGMRLIVGGAHYINEGEDVSLVKEVELAP
jgi:hypothetical protein